MIKTKDGYAKLIGTKLTGDYYSLLKSDGNVWEVNKTINNEADKIVRTNSEGILPTDKISVKTEIQLSDKNANIYRVGSSGTISNGRDRALLKTTTYSSNSTLYSIKTTSGSWDMSVYSDKLNLHFIKDNYYTGDSLEFITLTFPEKTGTLALTSNIPVIDIIAGVSKAVSSSSIRDPYIIVTSKIEDVLKNLGQVRLQGVGSTVINSNTADSIIVSSTLYKAGTGLQEISTDAASITGYKTTTMSVKLGFITTNDKYAVQSNSYGLYVQVPWRTIKINGTSIQRNELNLVEGNNITLRNSSGEVTISANDTKYEAGIGLTLQSLKFNINTGTDNNNERIYGVKVNESNKLYVTVPWKNTEYLAGSGLILDKTTNTFSHKDTSTAVENVQYGPSQNIMGYDGNTINIPYLKVDTYGHVITLGEREYTSKDTTYSFRGGDNCFYVTPLNGSEKQVSVNPITKSLKFKVSNTEVCDYTGNTQKTITFKVQNNLTISGDATGTITIDGSHGHKYAGSTQDGGPANSVAKALTIKIGTGSNEGVDLYTFNGSTSKTLNIVSGNNITLTSNSGKLTIAAIDTTYKATDGIKLESGYFKHINSVTAKTTYGSTGTTALANGGVITLTDVQYDKHGHITKSVDRNITLSQDHIKTSPSQGTAGTKNSTSGAALDIPYIDINSDGHITGYGVHRHTITGFLTSERYTGTVTSITPGIGLTGTYSDDPITDSGTINLKTTTTTEIGGIKIGYAESDKKYAIKLDGNDKAYVEVPWEDTDTWRPITDDYYGFSTSTSVSQYGTKLLYDDLFYDLYKLIPSEYTLPSAGDYYKPIYIDGGVPLPCRVNYHGIANFSSSSNGYIQCYQFGPIVILQGYISKLDLSCQSMSNPVFTLPYGCPTPYPEMGFPLVQRNGYENDRNTVIRINSNKGYADSAYSYYDPGDEKIRYPYYFSACYIGY